MKFEVGLAVNPQTTIANIAPLADKVDMVLFMSVNPGFYGAPFIPGVLKKIKEFKKLFPGKIVGIDGGIKLDNVRQVAGVGIDYLYIGSALLKNKNPKDAYKNLLARIG
jgi:ribulose-phosphate 3-epimerase